MCTSSYVINPTPMLTGISKDDASLSFVNCLGYMHDLLRTKECEF